MKAIEKASEPKPGASGTGQIPPSGEPDNKAPAGPIIEVIAFEAGGKCFALEAAWVAEVRRLRTLTSLPCAPGFVLGLAPVGGRIIAVICLSGFFGLGAAPADVLSSCLIVVEGKEMNFGITADSVIGWRGIPLSEIRTSFAAIERIDKRFVKGVGSDGLVVLDLAAMVTDPRFSADEMER